MKQPSVIHTVSEVQVIDVRGSWASKSGGELKMLFGLPASRLKEFLDFDNPAFTDVEQDIRGLRSYVVSGIAKGSVGAKEVHLARTELVLALDGKVLWTCVDLFGDEKAFTLDGSNVLVVPPGILHAYEALEDGTRLQVIANTLFIPEDPTTHDSYSDEEFYELQAALKNKETAGA